MKRLVPVHGGLEEPVRRIIPLSQKKEFIKECSALPTIQTTVADLATVYRITDGTLSPLEGPMEESEFYRVLEEKVIERDGKRYAWGIPIGFPVTDEEEKQLRAGAQAAVLNPAGEIVGRLEVTSVYDWDKERYVRGVYGTERFDHPGGRMVEQDPRTKLVGGRLESLPPPVNAKFGHFLCSPMVSRAFIADRGWERALAFQTRNPLHRAHEYALVAGVERLTREGHFTGVVLNPLVGELKGDDVPADTRMKCYQVLLENRLLGEGDKDTALWEEKGYDINDVFALMGVDIKMFYGGPSEAIMHAIYRQNLGFTDIVIGRKHADAPFEDGTPIWGDFDAQEIFDRLAGDLHIKPCKIGFAAYYESIGRVDLMTNHPDEKPFSISGSKIRELLKQGERPDSRILRSEVADILIEAYRSR